MEQMTNAIRNVNREVQLQQRHHRRTCRLCARQFVICERKYNCN